MVAPPLSPSRRPSSTPFGQQLLKDRHVIIFVRGHRIRKVQFFFNIVQKAFDPPPFRLNIYVVNFSEGILTKVRKRLSQQLSTK